MEAVVRAGTGMVVTVNDVVEAPDRIATALGTDATEGAMLSATDVPMPAGAAPSRVTAPTVVCPPVTLCAASEMARTDATFTVRLACAPSPLALA